MELQLRQSLFWDVDVQTIDLQKHRMSVIERVTQRGRWEEFKALLAYYGKDTVQDSLLKVRYLDKKTLAFCSTFFDIPKQMFRCYKLAQSNPTHWDY